MGGTVSLTIRDQNGNVHKTKQWTNGLAWFLDNHLLYEKDKEHLQEILNRGSKGDLVPEAYGLIVVDFVNDKIFDCNSYHSCGLEYGVIPFTEMSASSISGTRMQFQSSKPKLGKHVFSMFEARSDSSRLKNLYDKRRIKRITSFDKKEIPMVGNFNEMIELIESTQGRCIFEINSSPFEIKHFNYAEVTDQGGEVLIAPELILMKNAIQDLGFELTNEEENQFLFTQRIS